MFKRIIDIIAALLATIILFPILIITAILVRTKMGSPIFFTQIRPGLNGNTFKLIKFRTMTNECDEHGALLPSTKRLTRFGKFLRASSLDELPELWNVIRGDMSIVGPRPLLVEYLDHYSDRQALRHRVRPGITGWAQINGRNAISWEEKFELDVWYIENQNIILDIQIVVQTIWKVFQQQDIEPTSQEISRRFDAEYQDK